MYAEQCKNNALSTCEVNAGLLWLQKDSNMDMLLSGLPVKKESALCGCGRLVRHTINKTESVFNCAIVRGLNCVAADSK